MSEKTDAERLNEVINSMKRTELVHGLFVEMGSSLEQAIIASESQKIAEQFDFNGAILQFRGKSAYKAKQEIQDWLRQQHFDFVLPPPTPDPIADLHVDPALAKQAFLNGQSTAQGEFVRRYGMEAAKVHAERFGNPFNGTVGTIGKRGTIAATNDLHDDATAKVAAGGAAAIRQNAGPRNPWSVEGWSVSKQLSLVKLDPRVAAEIAASANSFIGATSPKSRNMTSYRRAV